MRRQRDLVFLMFVTYPIVATPLALSASDNRTFATVRTSDVAKKQGRDSHGNVELCHRPPGNPANARTIRVSRAAVSAHLAHGDTLGECSPSCGDAPAPVQKTGQTSCWDQLGNPIDCAGTGQDGDLQRGASASPRFSDNGDGTVTDNLTALHWLKAADCFGARDWTTASADASALASGACGLTDGSVAGDWRLPNLKELKSLIDYGQVGPALPAGHPFAGVLGQHFWSSVGGGSSAWNLFIGDGLDSIDEIGAPNIHVWPVRGGQDRSVDPRFDDNGDGTVSDNVTGLIWLKVADCFGTRDWTTAISDSRTLADGACGLTDGSAAGDWRLPNINELLSLIDFDHWTPALPPGHPFTGLQTFGLYWTSTTIADAPGLAWDLSMNTGRNSGDDKFYPAGYVWPVRCGR